MGMEMSPDSADTNFFLLLRPLEHNYVRAFPKTLPIKLLRAAEKYAFVFQSTVSEISDFASHSTNSTFRYRVHLRPNDVIVHP